MSSLLVLLLLLVLVLLIGFTSGAAWLDVMMAIDQIYYVALECLEPLSTVSPQRLPGAPSPTKD